MADTFWKKFYGTPDAVRTKRRQMRQVRMIGGICFYGEEAAEIRRKEERENGHPSCKLVVDGDTICGGLILGKVCEKCDNEVPE